MLPWEKEEEGYNKITSGKLILTANAREMDGDCMFHAVFPGKDPGKLRKQLCRYLR